MRVGVLERLVLGLDGHPCRFYDDPGLWALWFSRDLDSTVVLDPRQSSASRASSTSSSQARALASASRA